MSAFARQRIIASLLKLEGKTKLDPVGRGKYEWWHYYWRGGITLKMRRRSGQRPNNIMIRASSRDWSVDIVGRMADKVQDIRYRVIRMNGPRDQIEEDVIALMLSL